MIIIFFLDDPLRLTKLLQENKGKQFHCLLTTYTLTMSIRLFEEAAHASIYRKFRPTYPQKILELISDYIKTRTCGSFDLAVDVACGSGQSTFYLQETFKQCIGVDISKAQVEQARTACTEKEATNVSFVEGSADKLPMNDGSVDVVTIAQAWHWLEPEGFYKECKRVLKPRGCVAVYGYGQGHLMNKKSDVLLQQFYSGTLRGYWHDKRVHIDNQYGEVVLPFKNTERHDFSMTKDMSLDSYFGYVSTWSAYCKYCERNPGNSVLEELKKEIEAILTSEDGRNTDVQVSFPVFLLLGQNLN